MAVREPEAIYRDVNDESSQLMVCVCVSNLLPDMSLRVGKAPGNAACIY